MKINGFIKSDLDGSFVYFIFSKNLLYIGETQKITFSRWVSHFYKTGTFSKKVLKYGVPNVDDYIKEVNLLSIEIDEIRLYFNEVRWKTITQAIEHEIHVMLYMSQKGLIKNYYEKYEPSVNRFEIISDTTRTKPKKISNKEKEFVMEYSKKLMGEVYNYL